MGVGVRVADVVRFFASRLYRSRDYEPTARTRWLGAARSLAVDAGPGLTEEDDVVLDHLLPGSSDESAHEAVRSLLGEARRAIDERRQADLARVLEFLRGLIIDAMDEVQRHADWKSWEPPGSRAAWPPLRELRQHSRSFRDHLIRHGSQDDLAELTTLDLRLARMGVERRCGELFTESLLGYRTSYRIASRLGSGDTRRHLCERAWLVLRDTFVGEGVEELPYLREVARHQAELLYYAMEGGYRDDFSDIRDGCAGMLRNIGQRAEMKSPSSQGFPTWLADAEQDGRVALMEAGGTAMLLARAQRIDDPQPYLDTARTDYGALDLLAEDVGRAIEIHDSNPFFWTDILDTPSVAIEWTPGTPTNPALALFALRLLELVTDSAPDLDLKGAGWRVSRWFEGNVAWVEQYAKAEPHLSTDRRRELARKALRGAVRRDEVAEEVELAGRELSPARIGVFTADVYASVFTLNTIERLFTRSGAFRYVTVSDEDPPLRDASQFLSKGFLSEQSPQARSHYVGLDGVPWGSSLARDTIARLGEALEDAPTLNASVDSAVELLGAIEQARSSLNARAAVVVLLRGDWSRILVELDRIRADGYESPPLTRRGAAWDGERGRYHGDPIVVDYSDAERRLYVVEPGPWGVFARAQAGEGQDLLVEVDAIDAERAREMLADNPELLPDLPDVASKLLRMQTFVRVRVAQRSGFRVADPLHARRVVPHEPKPGTSSPHPVRSGPE